MERIIHACAAVDTGKEVLLVDINVHVPAFEEALLRCAYEHNLCDKERRLEMY